jgi:hypothetical protein
LLSLLLLEQCDTFLQAHRRLRLVFVVPSFATLGGHQTCSLGLPQVLGFPLFDLWVFISPVDLGARRFAGRGHVGIAAGRRRDKRLLDESSRGTAGFEGCNGGCCWFVKRSDSILEGIAGRLAGNWRRGSLGFGGLDGWLR